MVVCDCAPPLNGAEQGEWAQPGYIMPLLAMIQALTVLCSG